MDVQNFTDFFFSAAALPLLALLATMLVAFAAVVILWQQSRRLREVLEDIYKRHQQLVKSIKDIRSVSMPNENDVNINALAAMLAEQGKAIASVQAELVRLADGVNQQEQISRAIEMARQGSKRADLVDATGISAEQADAIVKFHGKNSG
ncbi:MAG: hypothetical protein CBD03_05130 [Rhizobiales bacterium TMED143]|nr:hypothetical protein [Rhodobiaceae bacterium]MBL6787679.1 hypothetical protein [PS1 clade bacterium]OUV91247.1 MAG: hypothetical protein CBD03_05130 [Rhizobiales bacterium TMED143]CAI8339572.1 MAG: Uncharacterised protein [Rhodobiaceae bacterium UBA7378]HCQ82892.1 hypothetical protein [Rhodobiaceae bacterium]|tara:strand:- start:639 stop:1088 length:450 start_codon:yes stop_codon:yes gene_type:complete